MQRNSCNSSTNSIHRLSSSGLPRSTASLFFLSGSVRKCKRGKQEPEFNLPRRGIRELARDPRGFGCRASCRHVRWDGEQGAGQRPTGCSTPDGKPKEVEHKKKGKKHYQAQRCGFSSSIMARKGLKQNSAEEFLQALGSLKGRSVCYDFNCATNDGNKACRDCLQGAVALTAFMAHHHQCPSPTQDILQETSQQPAAGRSGLVDSGGVCYSVLTPFCELK